MNTKRATPIDISQSEFIRIGHQLVHDIAEFNSSMSDKPVTTSKTPEEILSLIGKQNFQEIKLVDHSSL